jgi:hypothetical protein
MSCSPKWLFPVVLLAVAGCGETKTDKPATAAATVQATPPPPPKPASPGAVKLVIDAPSSKVDFLMEAPQEKIAGHVRGSSSGTLQVDPMDLTRSTGVLAVDIGGMEIFQTKADKDGKFGGEEKKVDAQNQHARTWLEISSDVPDAQREQNGRLSFIIKSVEVAGEKDLMKLPGAERMANLKVTGDFALHGKTVSKVLEIAATFKMEGDKIASVALKTTKPFAVGLAEHDVRPRDAFGKLAAKTLDILSPKVNKEALVSIDVTAKAH